MQFRFVSTRLRWNSFTENSLTISLPRMTNTFYSPRAIMLASRSSKPHFPVLRSPRERTGGMTWSFSDQSHWHSLTITLLVAYSPSQADVSCSWRIHSTVRIIYSTFSQSKAIAIRECKSLPLAKMFWSTKTSPRMKSSGFEAHMMLKCKVGPSSHTGGRLIKRQSGTYFVVYD